MISGSRAKWLVPAALFALALAVRAVGLTWGLPNAERFYSYHPDESPQQIVGAVFSLLQGDPNPHFFNYPSLTVYATWFFYQMLAGFGLTTNVSLGPDVYPWPIARDVILAGRLFSVLCGAGTAALSYGIARQLGLGRGAILAGILVALLPGLVQHSHYATVDVPATFFVALCVWLALRAHSAKAILVAALVAGLAAGTKYNAGLVALVPLACALMLGLKNRWALVISAPVVALLGFLVTTPYAVLDFPGFWGDSKMNGFAYELLVHPREGSGDIFQGTGNGWIYHLTFNLPFVMTAPLVVFALVGVGLAARERRWWPVLLFVGLFFLSLGFSQVRFMRYLFPLTPLLCIAAVWAVRRWPRPQFWGAGLALLALWGTKDVTMPFVKTDPRDKAAAYIKQIGAPVALANNPWFYTPPFQPLGFNRPVAGVGVVGFDASKIDPQTQIFVISEFERREAQRLNPNGPTEKFFDQLAEMTWKVRREPPSRATFAVFRHFDLTALPNRGFVPHDYLYSNPYILVYPFAQKR